MSQPRAYSYLRFSTPEQRKGDSFRRQTSLAKEYAERNGLILDTEVTFRDLGVSAYQGRNRQAGALGLFLEAVETGLIEKGSYLLVESLDRISRESARKAARTLEEICDMGVNVVTLHDGKVYNSKTLDLDPYAFIMTVLIFMRANEESATKARRLRAAWTAKRDKIAKGESIRLTSRCPQWLKPSNDSSAPFEIIPERGEIVQRIFSMTLEGTGAKTVAATLNQEGVPVFGRGKFWHPSYINKILKNTATYGVLTPFSSSPEKKSDRHALDPIENYYPAVIDRETFESVQMLKRKRDPRRGRHAKAETQNILGGLAVCPKCDSRVTRISKNKAKGWVYLVCTRAKQGAGCDYHAVRYDLIEPAIHSQIGSLISSCPVGDERVDEEIEQARAELDALDSAINNLLDLIQSGKLPDDSRAITKRLMDLESERESTNLRLKESLERETSFSNEIVMRRASKLLSAVTAIEDFKQTGFDGVRTQINTLLRETFEKVVVDYDTGELVFHWAHGGESSIIYTMPEVSEA